MLEPDTIFTHIYSMLLPQITSNSTFRDGCNKLLQLSPNEAAQLKSNYINQTYLDIALTDQN